MSGYRRNTKPTWTLISENGETPTQTLAHEIAHSLAGMSLGADSSVIQVQRTAQGLRPRTVTRGCNVRDPMVNAALAMASATNLTCLPGERGSEMLVDGPSPGDVQSVIDAGLDNPAVSAGAIRGAVFGVNVAAIAQAIAGHVISTNDIFQRAAALPVGQYIGIDCDEWLHTLLPVVVATWEQTEQVAQAVGRVASITLRTEAH